MSRTPLPQGHILRPSHKAASEPGYVIQRKLKDGGFGIAYEGLRAEGANSGGAHFWLSSYTRVAIKEFFPENMAERRGLEVVLSEDDPDTHALFDRSLERFLREAERLYFLTCMRAARAALKAQPANAAERDLQHDITQAIASPAFARNTSQAMQLVARLQGNLAQAAQQALATASLPIVHDFFMADGNAYYVMEYLEGLSLSERIRNARAEGGKATQIHHGQRFQVAPAMPWDRLSPFIGKTLDALEELHCGIPGQQLVHCDLTPGNIMFRAVSSQDPVLIDFGLARNTASADRSRSLAAGTEVYAPLEIDPAVAQLGNVVQLINGHADVGPWTDIYSLAVILRILGTGIDRDAIPAVLARWIEVDKGKRDPIAFLPPMAPDIPERAVRAIEHGLGLTRADRPQTIGQWRAEFGLSENSQPRSGWGLGGAAKLDARSQPHSGLDHGGWDHGGLVSGGLPSGDADRADYAHGDRSATRSRPLDGGTGSGQPGAPQSGDGTLALRKNHLLAGVVGLAAVAALAVGYVVLPDSKPAPHPTNSAAPVDIAAKETVSAAQGAVDANQGKPIPQLAQNVMKEQPAAAPAMAPPQANPAPAETSAIKVPAAQARRFGELGIAVRTITDKARLAQLVTDGWKPNDPVVVTDVFKNVGINQNEVYIYDCNMRSALAALEKANAGNRVCLINDDAKMVTLNGQ
jgi:serine/threonine protein kinase